MKISGRYVHIVVFLLSMAFLTQPVEGRKHRRRKKAKEPVEQVRKPAKKPVIAKDTTKKTPPAETKKASEEKAVLFVPVPEWVGKKFILLEKTKVFRKFGYELYLSPQLSNSTGPPDPKVVLKSHRLKYKPFCKSIVTVTAVEKDGRGEYLVTFTMAGTGLTVYGKTKDGIIEGIAMVSDLRRARERWQGKTVYCRRRCIDIYDSLKSTFTSVKVPITEPLKVLSVRWGVIPLPPKLLWLTVERTDGSRGIIPVNISWTNVIKFEKQVDVPWEHELFEKNPKEIYSWDRYVWESIDSHTIFIGMTSQQVRFSWGEPQNKFAGKDDRGKDIETYQYDGKTLTFENGVLVRTAE